MQVDVYDYDLATDRKRLAMRDVSVESVMGDDHEERLYRMVDRLPDAQQRLDLLDIKGDLGVVVVELMEIEQHGEIVA